MTNNPENSITAELHTDMSRRTALKVIGGAAVLATTPALTGQSFAATPQPGQLDTQTIHAGSSAELSMQLTLEPEPLLTMTNNSDQLVIVRHVYPGIVHAGDKAFDINAVFERSAYAISAGSTRRVPIAPVSHTTAEAQFPREKYRKSPQRIVSVTGFDKHGPLVNSTRSFYA